MNPETGAMTPWLDQGFAALLQPLTRLAEPGMRVYWPSLLLSLLVVVVVLRARARRRRHPLRVWWRALFRRRFWLHPSARLDYALIVVKALLRVALFAPLMLSALAVAAGVVRGLDAALGVPGVTDLSRAGVNVAYTVVLFVASDLSRYLVHRWLHSNAWLWEIHQVHHSAEVLTPFTVYRSHPIESYLYALRGVLVTGLVTGLFFHLFRGRMTQYDVLGVNAIGFVFNLACANLRHAQVWLSYGPRLERWLISPALHQIHHSADPAHHHRNMGAFLAVWDRLGGTLYVPGRRLRLRFGLPKETLNHTPTRLWSALTGPLTAVGRHAGQGLGAAAAGGGPARANRRRVPNTGGAHARLVAPGRSALAGRRPRRRPRKQSPRRRGRQGRQPGDAW